MTFYIIDILQPKVEELSTEDQFTAEQLFLHKDVFRGCTINWNHMSNYYRYLEDTFGKYFTIGTYKYVRHTSFDDVPIDKINEDTISSICLALYNSNREDHENNIGTMPVIQALPLERGGMLYITEAMQELMNEIYFTEMEFSTIFKFAAVFIELYNYLPGVNQNENLVWLKEFIIKGLPELVLDFYDTNHIYHTDPVYLNKVLIETLVFLK